MQSGFHTFISEIDDRLGMIDSDGKVLIPNKYASLKRLTSTKVLATKEDGSQKHLIIPDEKKTTHLSKVDYKGNTIFHDYYLHPKTNKVDKTLGVISGSDTLLHSNLYLSKSPLSMPFWDSLYTIQSVDHEGYGLVNYKGQVVMEPQATRIQKTSQPHLFNVQIDGKNGIYNIHEQKLDTADFDMFVSAKYTYISTQQNGLKGIMDLERKELIPMTYDQIYYNNGHFILKKDESYSIFSLANNTFSDETFTKVDYRNKMVDIVRLGNKYALYDGKDLSYITDTIYDQLESVTKLYIEGFQLTYDTTSINPQANPEIENQEKKPRNHMKASRTYTYFDTNGAVIHGPGTLKLHPVTDSVFVYYDDTLMTFINLRNNDIYTIKKTRYDKNKYTISIDGKYVFPFQLIQKKEKTPRYESLETINDSKIYIYEIDGLYGLMTIDNKITEPIYDEIKEHYIDLLKVKYKGKYGIMKIFEE